MTGRRAAAAADLSRWFPALIAERTDALNAVTMGRLPKHWRHFIQFVMLFALLAATTWWIVGKSAQMMLKADAESTAKGWAEYLVRNVSDLRPIMQGEMPTMESVVFFEQAKKIGNVYLFRIFDRDGRLRVVSDQLGRINTYQQRFIDTYPGELRDVIAGRVRISSRAGRYGEPSFLAKANIPIRDGDEVIGVLEVSVDEGDKQTELYKVLVLFAGTLGIVLVLAFGVPTLAYWQKTRQKEQAEERLRFLALNDPLTQLSNRASILHLLQERLQVENVGTGLAFHYLDLDQFKAINDTLGHDFGDELLHQVANRLRKTLGRGGTAGRLGGDEFVVVQYPLADRAAAEALAATLVATLCEPFEVRGQILHIGTSIGISLAPGDSADVDRLIKCADLALYAAKSAGRGTYRFFEPAMDEAMLRRRELEVLIRDSLDANRFELHCQPLIDLRSQRIASFEALVRLRGHDGKYISPAEFIPVAEETGLIGRIGAFVLHEACRIAAGWPDAVGIAVNLSPAEFRGGAVVDLVKSALAASGLAPSRLELEVTEGLLLRDTDTTHQLINSLKALGVSLALDDFGTGYSSFNYLWRFPFDKLKIDRSFVTALGSKESASDIVRTLVTLGHTLRLKVTAEGIETPAQAAALSAMGCDFGQGYLFSRPVPSAETRGMIEADRQRACEATEVRAPMAEVVRIAV